MPKLKKSWITFAVVISLVGVSSVALAEHVDDHPEDTEFSFAYDADDHFLAINISDNDTGWVCDYGPDTLTGTYGDPDGDVLIEELRDEDTTDYEFSARPEDEVGDDYEVEEGTTPYTAEGPCIVNGIVVAGPNGQINHGQFLKAAKSLFEVKGHGCIVRHLAQSDIGKGETQLKTPEVDEEWGFDEAEDGANLTFSGFEADCKHGKKDKNDESQTKKIDRPRGNSAAAPGKNK